MGFVSPRDIDVTVLCESPQELTHNAFDKYNQLRDCAFVQTLNLFMFVVCVCVCVCSTCHSVCVLLKRKVMTVSQ